MNKTTLQRRRNNRSYDNKGRVELVGILGEKYCLHNSLLSFLIYQVPLGLYFNMTQFQFQHN